MTIWKILKQFNYNQLWQLFLLALKYPIYVYPTLKATVQGYQISKNEFPETHGKNGKGNAFRHALWNLLICYECYQWRKDKDRVTAWAKIITDKHEELSPNHPLDEAMDLHNNAYGRQLFENLNNLKSKLTNEIIISRLKIDLEYSIKITEVSDTNEFTDNLVHINDIV